MIAIYCRTSQEKDTKDRSINDQKLRGIELANKLNIEYRVYVDEGISGTKNIDERPALSKLIEDIYNKEITSVYVYDQSRLERSLEARFAINKVFNQENIQLYTDNGLVGKDIESEFTGDLISVINNFYVKMTAKKVKAVQRRNMLEGKATTILPYGYTTGDDKKVIIEPYKASVVRDIYNWSIGGMGARRISHKLNDLSIPPPKNKPWAAFHVHAILKDTKYNGRRIVDDTTYPFPIIIDDDTWSKQQLAKKTKHTGSGPVVKGKYLLREVLKCSCNYRMVGMENYKVQRYKCGRQRYKDNTCKEPSILLKPLDEFIKVKLMSTGKLRELILSDLEARKSSGKAITLQKEIKALKTANLKANKQLNNLIEAIADGILDKDDAKSKISSLKLSISRNNSTIEVKNKELAIPDEVELNIDSTSIDNLVESITVTHIEKKLYYIDINFSITKVRYILDTKNNCAYRGNELYYLTGFTGNVVYKLEEGATISPIR
jgi:DNA invertase Pin-like site-specific DNA recombinase